MFHEHINLTMWKVDSVSVSNCEVQLYNVEAHYQYDLWNHHELDSCFIFDAQQLNLTFNLSVEF